MFREPEKESFDERELRIQKFWEENKIFERSVEGRSDHPPFSFYDGPPFATGLPHYGHLLAGTIKDVIPRYKTMKGYCVPRRFGWDCHGLPVESEIEKAHSLHGAHSIEEFGIGNFNEACREIVLRYSSEWEAIVKRMGRWVDFNHTYHTMDLTFMESVWWVFKQLYDKQMVYEGYKVVPFSAKLGTPLSNFEAGENYKEVDDPSLTVSFPLKDETNTFLLAWTTTPWTLVSNLALMVGPDIDYVKVKDAKDGHHYILAKNAVGTYYRDQNGFSIVEEFKGETLKDRRYEPLFPYWADRNEAFRVLLEPNVSLEEGTGIVHSAPAFGELDFFACQREGIELVCPVNNNGCFTEEIPEYQGQFVKDADKAIIKRLKEEGRVVHHSTCRHRYPFCWRTDTPLIYKAVRSWFISVEKFRDKLLVANREIHWTPHHIKYGRFGKWLEGARDWAVSRNRYWGTPIPLWRSKEGDIMVIGSVEELEELTGETVKDLHRHNIDHLTFTIDGKTYERIPQVFDCWFESGSMPYAQNHYPFGDRRIFEQSFPADFIAEGIDQTRGWFYTLTVLSSALFHRPAFKNVIVNGIILAEDGTKMSKRLRNYPDPMEVVKKYGADAVRLYMMHSPAVRGDNLCFCERGVELVLRQIMIPMWNAYSFFVTYARIYNWQPLEIVEKPTAIIDQWIISKLNGLIRDVEQGMDDYDLSRAVEPFVGFIGELTNWYIRRSRRRFWSDEATNDREEAFSTLYQVLIELTKIAAPFVPFISEAIFQNLRTEDNSFSVHLCDFPVYYDSLCQPELETGMAALQTVVSMGHALRKENSLKVRQPLLAAHIACAEETTLKFLEEQQHLIADELNVKEVVFGGDETQFVQLKAKPNFRILGKKVGRLMPQAKEAIEKFDQEMLGELLERGLLATTFGGEEFTLTVEDIEVDRQVHEGMVAANSSHVTIALDTTLNDDLINEGMAREVVNKINKMRKEGGLAVTDRIKLQIETTDRAKNAFTIWQNDIKEEVLALEVEFVAECDGDEWDINGEKTKIALAKT